MTVRVWGEVRNKKKEDDTLEVARRDGPWRRKEDRHEDVKTLAKSERAQEGEGSPPAPPVGEGDVGLVVCENGRRVLRDYGRCCPSFSM